MKYEVQYAHVTAGPASAELPDNCFSDRKTLGAALRAAGILAAGARLRGFRTEGDRVICPLVRRAGAAGPYWPFIVLIAGGAS